MEMDVHGHGCGLSQLIVPQLWKGKYSPAVNPESSADVCMRSSGKY